MVSVLRLTSLLIVAISLLAPVAQSNDSVNITHNASATSEAIPATDASASENSQKEPCRNKNGCENIFGEPLIIFFASCFVIIVCWLSYAVFQLRKEDLKQLQKHVLYESFWNYQQRLKQLCSYTIRPVNSLPPCGSWMAELPTGATYSLSFRCDGTLHGSRADADGTSMICGKFEWCESEQTVMWIEYPPCDAPPADMTADAFLDDNLEDFLRARSGLHRVCRARFILPERSLDGSEAGLGIAIDGYLTTCLGTSKLILRSHQSCRPAAAPKPMVGVQVVGEPSLFLAKHVPLAVAALPLPIGVGSPEPPAGTAHVNHLDGGRNSNGSDVSSSTADGSSSRRNTCTSDRSASEISPVVAVADVVHSPAVRVAGPALA